MRGSCYQLLLSSLLVAQLSLAAVAANRAAKSQPGLVPWPKALTMGEDFLVISDNSRILAARQDLLPLAKVLSEEIHLATGRQLATGVDQPRAGDVVLAIDPALRGEAYTIDVKGCAVVKGGNYQSAAFGTATLLQAMKSDGLAVTISRMSVLDQPAYPYRAAMIDLGASTTLRAASNRSSSSAGCIRSDTCTSTSPMTSFSCSPRRSFRSWVRATGNSPVSSPGRSPRSCRIRARNCWTWSGSHRRGASTSCPRSICPAMRAGWSATPMRCSVSPARRNAQHRQSQDARSGHRAMERGDGHFPRHTLRPLGRRRGGVGRPGGHGRVQRASEQISKDQERP